MVGTTRQYVCVCVCAYVYGIILSIITVKCELGFLLGFARI